MEKIIVIKTRERVVPVSFHDYENSLDLLYSSVFKFSFGKTYGIIGEHGSGGWALSSILSGKVSLEGEEIIIDGIDSTISEIGWYVGEPLYKIRNMKKEKKVIEELEDAIKKYKKYNNIEDILSNFHLSKDRLHYGISSLGIEKWRASIAIGYAMNRQIYCFPWMDSSLFYDVMVNSGVYACFDFLKEAGSLVILPTSKKENVELITDDCIELCNSRFLKKCSDNIVVQKYYINK